MRDYSFYFWLILVVAASVAIAGLTYPIHAQAESDNIQIHVYRTTFQCVYVFESVNRALAVISSTNAQGCTIQRLQ